ncbi:short-chain dehydrogenase/reductase SDR [Novosphingobium aromaticivorans DSM 12444]|uniref:Short-chain dehydrogenase/reductase SDR n=1 Tax=Novosphingobium aromaticivorans (strain ATCC 700278 / DSM 12444 / CCUG 56034 / CIP 105152 / NBRC 16084 / F199) TaxID=279238 RepID=Q2G9V4_NOVAD|nr:SDR family oxidoreductase [Novosphingobium aromaticivorans]ABD25369.1 short-chain dehydrogenase/reductase SDR [Novosphingobium aromaticivorans DSM 12444]SCX91353.1 NAD(P)-dependent dehydrogenase, short-chain alcohol dehydrogenase family [Novosphingobium aromaticivorans]
MTRPLALVTGGWRRIGGAIARKLASEGWDLALHAHHDRSFDAEFKAQLEWLGATVFPVSGDLDDRDFPARLLAEVVGAAGRSPELLVNSASLFHDDRVETITPEELEQHFRVNLFAPLLLTRAFAEALGDRDGSVVNILDQRVLNPVPDQISYTISKQALHASVRTLARAMAPRVRVNGVAPGLILPTADYDAEQWRRLEEIMPLRRLPGADEIADAVHFLASARSVTGQTLFVDAGASLESYPRDFVYLEK